MGRIRRYEANFSSFGGGGMMFLNKFVFNVDALHGSIIVDCTTGVKDSIIRRIMDKK